MAKTIEDRARTEASPERRLRLFVTLILGAFAALAIVPQVSFWLSVAALCYTYAAYPLLLAIFVGLRPSREEPPEHLPTVSILIAAHNEEAAIAQTIRNALDLNYPKEKLEVVVVSDGSTDRTNAILHAIQDPRVRWLCLPTQSGKTQAQNRAVLTCTSEIIIFSDATTIYDRNAIRLLVRHYYRPDVGAVSGRYEYIQPDPRHPAIIGTAVFWRFENLLKLLQSRAGTVTGCSGCIYSVRRSLYTPLHPNSCSDLVEPLAIIRKGYRVVFEDQALAFELSSATVEEEFRMRVRVAGHGIRSILDNADLLNIFRHGWVSLQLLSHKVLRWMTALFLVNLLAISIFSMDREPFKTALKAQLLFYAVSFLSSFAPRRGRWKILGLPFYFCALHAAVLVGAWEVSSGKVYAIWRPVRANNAPSRTLPINQGKTG